MASQQSALRPLAAHLLSLGLADGDALPPLAEVAEAVGVTKRSVIRLLGDMRLAGALQENETVGQPPRVLCRDVIEWLASEEGAAQFKGASRSDAERVQERGSPEAWQVVISKFDEIINALRENTAEVKALRADLSGVRQNIQTEGAGVVAPLVSEIVARLGGAAAAASRLGVHGDTVRRLARGSQQAGVKMESKIKALAQELNIE